MITVKDLRALFEDTWFVLEDENGRDVFVEKDEYKRDISEFDKCEVRGAFPDGGEDNQIVCYINSSDPNYPKKRRYEFNGSWTYVVEANSLQEAKKIFNNVYTEEFYIHDDIYEVTELED